MKNSIRKIVVFTLLIAIGLLSTGQDEAQAMPGFARKHNSPCSSCHIAFPKLNAFGIAFKQRGYRMEDEGPGEPVWKLKGIPLGAVAQIVYESQKQDGKRKTNREAVNAVEFFFGGVLGENVSFFGDFGADFDHETGEFGALTPDVAFVVFDDVVSDGLLNIKVGSMDVDFPFLSDPRSPTLSGYLTRLDAGGEDGVTMGKKGIELNGFYEETNTRYAVGVGNTAVENAESSLGAIHAWVAQTFEVMGFEQTIGAMGSLDKSGDELVSTDDSTSAFGVALDLHYGLSGLILAYHDYSGNTKNSFGATEASVGIVGGAAGVVAATPGTPDADVTSWLAEFFHSFSAKMVGVARYDFQDTDGSKAEKSQYTAGLQYFVRPNVKAQAEYSSLTETDGGGTDIDTQTATLALTIGF